MTVLRLFGIVGVLVAMAVAVKSGMLPFGGSASGTGNVSLQQDINQATFMGAQMALDVNHAGSGTYAGAPPSKGFSVIRADSASYCIQAELQAQSGPVVYHVVGPNGSVTAGAC